MMRITVRIKPRSKKGPLVEPGLLGELVVYVHEPAVDGKANAAVVKLLADYYDVPKRAVSIMSGHKSRIKIVAIDS
jgi:hypothetical protein